jgi:hypothetical protein
MLCLPLRSSNYNFVCIYYLPTACYMQSHPPLFNYPNK